MSNHDRKWSKKQSPSQKTKNLKVGTINKGGYNFDQISWILKA
jgi:hypothetical protein